MQPRGSGAPPPDPIPALRPIWIPIMSSRLKATITKREAITHALRDGQWRSARATGISLVQLVHQMQRCLPATRRGW